MQARPWNLTLTMRTSISINMISSQSIWINQYNQREKALRQTKAVMITIVFSMVLINSKRRNMVNKCLQIFQIILILIRSFMIKIKALLWVWIWAIKIQHLGSNNKIRIQINITTRWVLQITISTIKSRSIPQSLARKIYNHNQEKLYIPNIKMETPSR